MEPVAVRSSAGRAATPRSDERRARGAAHDAAPRARRSGAHQRRRGKRAIALFELARVYLPTGEQLPEERWRVGGIAEGGFDGRPSAVEALYEALHVPLESGERRGAPSPGQGGGNRRRVARRAAPGTPRGSWGVFELDVEALMEPLPERILYEDVITYPANRQDIAVVVAEDVEAGAIVAAAREAGGPELREARVFDVYRGDQVGRRAEVGCTPPRLPVARANAHGRRGRRVASPDRDAALGSASAPSSQREKTVGRSRRRERAMRRCRRLALVAFVGAWSWRSPRGGPKLPGSSVPDSPSRSRCAGAGRHEARRGRGRD